MERSIDGMIANDRQNNECKDEWKDMDERAHNGLDAGLKGISDDKWNYVVLFGISSGVSFDVLFGVSFEDIDEKMYNELNSGLKDASDDEWIDVVSFGVSLLF